MEKTRFLASPHNRSVVIKSKNHSGQKWEDNLFEANSLTLKSSQVPQWILSECRPSVSKIRVIAVGLPDKDVDITGEHSFVSSVYMQRDIQVEKIAEVVIHVDS